MAEAAHPIADRAPSSIRDLLLPLDPPQYGPVTGTLIRRTWLGLFVLFVLGAVMAITGDSPAVRAAGLSLIFPGGGFLFDAWPVLFLITLVAMGFAVLLWWGLSAFFTIPLVWLVSVAASAWLADGPRLWFPADTVWAASIPLVMVGTTLFYAALWLRSRSAHRRKLESIPAMNAYLESAPEPVPAAPPLEPTDFDREVLGWMYELALQPADQFEGFDWGEQYHGGTCLRYQLAFLGESLAAYAVNALPNYQQVIEPALASLVERMTDQRVWKYWQVENFLATGSLDPDPIRNDNVMLTGFYQSQISLYEAATGSTRFDEPGCLKFVWKDGRVFAYDHKSISEAIVDNLERSNLGLYSCEPTWVFTICNTQAAQGLVGYDRIHGTDYWARVEERFRKGLTEEMMTADGGFRHIRTNVFGFSFNDGDGSGEYFTSGSHNWEDVAPDLARRGRIFALRGVSEKMAALEGKIREGYLDLEVEPARERATYIVSKLGGWTGIIGAARAVGNEAVAAAATRSMWRACATGQRFPERPLAAGVQSIAVALWPLWGSPMSLGQINQRGYVPPVGPVLEQAPWPEVIVTKARCDDGEGLDLVIEPYRDAPAVDRAFQFRALLPGARYRLQGNGIDRVITADATGRASALFPVTARLDLRLVPVHA
jgi:Linalool dehydratase/isomerase